MAYSIAALGEDLLEEGWKVSHTEFGRQSWTIPTSAGSATITVRMSGSGVVGTLDTVTTHSGEGDPWDEEDVTLEVGPTGGIMPIHRPESEVAVTLRKWSRLIALEVER